MNKSFENTYTKSQYDKYTEQTLISNTSNLIKKDNLVWIQNMSSELSIPKQNSVDGKRMNNPYSQFGGTVARNDFLEETKDGEIILTPRTIQNEQLLINIRLCKYSVIKK